MILSIGDVMLDVMLLPSLQREEQSRGIAVRAGGSAANTAAWLAHLGVDSTFVGCTGDDPPGDMLAHELRAHGVRCAIRTVAGSESGAVAVEIGVGGERVMRSARGANEALAPDDILAAPTTGVVAVHITGYALLGPAGFRLLHAAAEVAHDAGALLSFDPSSVGVIERLGADRLLMEVDRCTVGLLLPNRVEAESLTGEGDAVDAARSLAAAIPLVVVKAARAGAAFAGVASFGKVPARPAEAIDSTGAGDAFDAGLLAALTTGQTLGAACRLANATAGHAITRLGGRPPRSGRRPVSLR